MTGYMVDTNVFDGILDGTIAISTVDGPLYATSIQRDEISVIPNEEKRTSLLAIFHASIRLNTPVAVWDVSSWDEANFGTPEQNEFVETFAAELRAADHISRKRPKAPLLNSMRDALIAITAREHGLVLITGDKNLEALASRRGISTRFI
jgi:predicted nucleic acid-binding protein